MQDDIQLIEECKQRSNSAFEKCYNKYAQKMKGVAYRYLGDHAKAEDVLHDSFVKVYEKINTLKDNTLFEGWLRRIVVNQALDLLKSEKKLKEIEHAGQLNQDDESSNSEGYGTISSKQLSDALASLPMGYKTIFNLHVVDGFQHKEIAERLGISEGTSKSQLAKAKLFLKKKLEKPVQINEE